MNGFLFENGGGDLVKKQTITLTILRQDGPEDDAYWESFAIPYRENMNVISALMYIQKHPVTTRGKESTPVQWEMSCLEEVCGACSMIINGKARQACATLIDDLDEPIQLKPMRTFPVVRDLIVDRQEMFESLKKVKAWIPIDGTHDLGPGPRFSETKREWAYELSKCMTCGVCLEACPNVYEDGNFIGPAAISQVRLFNTHPTGELHKAERLRALMADGGIGGCSNSQNCIEVCPKGIPLTTSIAAMNRETTLQSFKDFFGSDY